ncbi:hypothetical protein EPUS_08789 [Endocarpon pusillum Z07020]|uniref:Uncharacterized protein n=1 Tax=Endocarpon pusillum (strain Z07020 / HMAS-L-300199) TaxID=1263415 RepID=U1HJG1_ENDPU|nr:uncharacterized protein EPUS_08789 [Endocarpon pusillum Z07020]ERF70365.1 hypothetical protein EPUS_08789 [Endocarpon pusillum Z07020]
MKFNPPFTLLAIFFALHFTDALPLSGSHKERQVAPRKAPYSVVPVDGGQSDGITQPTTQIVTSDSTQTVTEPPRTIPPVTETLLSTTIVTESEAQATTITTITTTSTPVTTQVSVKEASPSVDISVATVTTIVSTADKVTITLTPSVTPYDNGMWHTTYYKVVEASSSSETSSTKTADQTHSSIIGTDSAAFTGQPSNGTYTLVLRGKNHSTPSSTINNGTLFTNSTTAALANKPPMPTLPKVSEVVNPTEVPTIDVAKNMVPGFGR